MQLGVLNSGNLPALLGNWGRHDFYNHLRHTCGEAEHLSPDLEQALRQISLQCLDPPWNVNMQVTRARVFDDFGGAALGNWGRRAVYVTVYATILAEPIIFHLTSMEALQQIFYGAGLTQKFAALLVTVVMVPLAQVSHADLHSSSTDACAIHGQHLHKKHLPMAEVSLHACWPCDIWEKALRHKCCVCRFKELRR